MEPKKTFQEYSRNEEIVNIITHGIGIPLSLVAAYYLFSSGSTMYLAFGIYTFSMLATYLSSTLYHLASSANLKRKNLLHLLDHAAIYLFIAGTYTPISFLVLSGSTLWWILGSVWTFALVGIILKIFFIGKYRILSSLMYLLMGWMIVFAINDLLANTPEISLLYLLLGGISYSIGVVFYLLKKMPYSHGIWHLFVLGGSIFHFLCVYSFLA